MPDTLLESLLTVATDEHYRHVSTDLTQFEEGLLAAQGITSSSSEQTSEPYYKDGYALRLHVGGKAIGSLGLIRDEIRSTWRITSPVATLEVRLEPLLENFGALSTLTPVAP